jgi:hypothetical protein
MLLGPSQRSWERETRVCFYSGNLCGHSTNGR